MALKCFHYNIDELNVRVPILVNAKDLDANEEALCDKSSAAGFAAVRSAVSPVEYASAAKRRKLK